MVNIKDKNGIDDSLFYVIDLNFTLSSAWIGEAIVVPFSNWHIHLGKSLSIFLKM